MHEDELSDGDRKWELCVIADRPYRDIWRALASYPTFTPWSVIGVTKRNFNTADDGYWKMVHAWVKAFVPKWEDRFRKLVDELENKTVDVGVASLALNVSPELLNYFVNHKEQIETFLEAQRPMLGLIAESKLWELVLQGDPATVRWFLERVRSDVYGKAEKIGAKTDEVQTIEIVRG